MEIPIPKGLELPDVPEGETIKLSVTFAVEGNMLEVLEIDGVPVEEGPEDMMETEASSEKEDFISAVNRQLPQ